MPEIREECPDCGGTGLYSGMCEGPGTAVVCLGCEGRGWREYRYREFTHRKAKRGIRTIRMSRGRFLATGVSGSGETMSYAEFEQKFPV